MKKLSFNGQLERLLASIKHPHGKLPPDPEGCNDQRARWAAMALAMFMSQTGSDPEDAVADLLANLRHYCDRASLSWEHEDRRGHRHYTEEVWGEAEPLLPAKTQVQYKLTATQDTDVRPEHELDTEPAEIYRIHSRLKAGDVWAWASVCVQASWIDPRTGTLYTGEDWLGGCSYEDEADFRRCGYYQDMCQRAFEELVAKVTGNVKI